MKFLISLLIVTSNMFSDNNTSTLNLIPKPQEVILSNGNFILSRETNLININADVKLVDYFIEKIKSLTGIEISTSNSKAQEVKIIMHVEEKSDLSNESYSLMISEKEIKISASTNEGIFRGLQTIFQLIPAEVKIKKNFTEIKLQCCMIKDEPKFLWRGLNLDCCRHFMTKDFIKRYIDILAYYKFNTLHWHLTEDQGWRIEIKKYPKLTEIGAWRKEADGTIYGGFYTQDDIKEIVEYADSRYINIVPEIEMPGHSLASLASYPENSCTGGPFEVTNMFGVMKDVYCAGNDSTYIFLQNILDEVITLFPGKYIHIGGDEVPKDRWKNCPKCQSKIQSENLKDEKELQSYFIKRISNYLLSKNRQVIGWDEILEGGLAPGAIVQSWQSFQGAVEAAKLGHFVVCSPASHTYLNSDPENLDLRIAYSFEPIPDDLSSEEQKYILGGEANLWTEHAPQETVDSKLFPRILALAEVFWNDPHNKNYEEFYLRVQNSYNDLTALGIQYGREGKIFSLFTEFDDFKRQFTIKIKRLQPAVEIRYTTDGSVPNQNSKLYLEPIKIDSTSIVNIAAFKDMRSIGKQYSLSFSFHKALNAKIFLKNSYDERYRAGGDNALIDGVRGSDNFRDGLWQGFEGVDFESLIDLGEEKEISKIIPRFLLDSNSWIFLPNKVEILISKDDKNFSTVKTIMNNVPLKSSKIIQKDFTAEFQNTMARYIKVRAENIKKCPDWHPSAGGKAWLMIDEIVVE